MRRIVTIASALIVIVGAFLAGQYSDNPFRTPCADEGSNGCFWDAQHMGNGVGTSYVVTADEVVYYPAP